jgi:hypothetical protein
MASWLSGSVYRDFHVAALVQLAHVESGFRPCAAGPGGYRYLLQWGGGRLRQLREFAQTSDCPHLLHSAGVHRQGAAPRPQILLGHEHEAGRLCCAAPHLRPRQLLTRFDRVVQLI